MRIRIAVVVAAMLSFLLTGAHFLRLGNIGLAVCCLGLAALALSRQAFARLVLCASLLATMPVWLDVSAGLIRMRIAAGLPWGRLGVIMAAVVGLQAAATLLLASSWGQQAFPREQGLAWPKAIAMLLSAALLGLTQLYAPITALLAERFMPGAGWPEIFLLSFYAAWLCGRLLTPRCAASARSTAWLIFSAIFFAQLFLGLAGISRMLMTGALHLPVPALIAAGPLYRGQGFFMLGLFVSSVLLVGPAWCSHLCYIGAWDDALSRHGPRPPLTAWRWRWRSRVVLTAFILGAAWLLRAYPDPIVGNLAWFDILAALFGLAGVGAMILISRRRGSMVHCTAYCPMGLMANILGRISPWRMRMSPDCTGCGRCAAACRYGALEPEHISRRRPGLGCTLCGDCLTACRHAAMFMSFPGVTPSVARIAFAILASAIHVLFVGVARL